MSLLNDLLAGNIAIDVRASRYNDLVELSDFIERYYPYTIKGKKTIKKISLSFPTKALCFYDNNYKEWFGYPNRLHPYYVDYRFTAGNILDDIGTTIIDEKDFEEMFT